MTAIHEQRKHIISPEYARLMRLATWASVFVASILIAIKFYAWVITDSVSMMSSLIDSFLDMIVSLVNLMAVRYALMPPDEEHRFGHTAAEDVAALAQSAFIAGSAVFIAISAIRRLMNPELIHQADLGVYVMIFSIFATIALVLFQKYVVKKTKSSAIGADSLHYISDLLMNVSIIVALVLSSKFGMVYADPIFAIFIAVYISYGAWKIGFEAFNKLLDKEFDDEEREKIKQTVREYPGAINIHNLKTRYSGIKPFIQFHLELDGTQTLHDAHEIADGLEAKLMEMFPGGEVIIHQDPVYPVENE